MRHVKNCDAAAQGATFMDAHRPGWENEIDLDDLNLGDGFFCILGQLYGNYQVGTQRTGLHDGVVNILRQYSLGFMASIFGGSAEYIMLTNAWRTEILIRRQKAGVAREIRKPRYSPTKTPTRS